MLDRLLFFWLKHPALFHSISLILGAYAFFHSFALVLIPSLFFWTPFCINLFYHPFIRPLFALNLLLFILIYFFLAVSYEFPHLPDKGLIGKAHLSIDSLDKQRSPFGTQWNFHCTLLGFFPDSSPHHSIAKQIKCIVSIPQSGFLQRPLAQREYIVHGKLSKPGKGDYRLKVSNVEPWLGLKENWGFTEHRFQWKKKTAEWIRKQFNNSITGFFLAGLATGEMNVSWVKEEFSRFGLQHLLAISGFHFAMLAGLLSFLLRLLFPRKIQAILLLVFLAIYFTFLGFNASVVRAWIMSSLVILSDIFEKQSTPLNNLGIAIIGILFIDPSLLNTVGFQLSFFITASILLGHQPASRWLDLWISKRRLNQVIEMDGWNQHGYLILTLFKQVLALTIAVNLVALPMTLYLFQQFPVIGLFYNLFFPFLVSISLVLLFLGAFLSFIPLIGKGIVFLNDIYTGFVLKLTYQMPDFIDHYIETEFINPYFLIGYLSLLVTLLIINNQFYEEISEENYEAKWLFF